MIGLPRSYGFATVDQKCQNRFAGIRDLSES
jgi:hypothetical protein